MTIVIEYSNGNKKFLYATVAEWDNERGVLICGKELFDIEKFYTDKNDIKTIKINDCYVYYENN